MRSLVKGPPYCQCQPWGSGLAFLKDIEGSAQRVLSGTAEQDLFPQHRSTSRWCHQLLQSGAKCRSRGVFCSARPGPGSASEATCLRQSTPTTHGVAGLGITIPAWGFEQKTIDLPDPQHGVDPSPRGAQHGLPLSLSRAGRISDTAQVPSAPYTQRDIGEGGGRQRNLEHIFAPSASYARILVCDSTDIDHDSTINLSQAAKWL